MVWRNNMKQYKIITDNENFSIQNPTYFSIWEFRVVSQHSNPHFLYGIIQKIVQTFNTEIKLHWKQNIAQVYLYLLEVVQQK